uniref:Glycosyl transferase family 2 n=1 Tax=Candidatus Kentrum sp. FW TaxID=2126338 RepID=A0A450TGS1_9GAMM|nr:MAG: Glycosyl transferase family 2 [Candidatus Kentron sp. FW]
MKSQDRFNTGKIFGLSLITTAYKTNRTMVDAYFDSVSNLVCPPGVCFEIIYVVDGDEDLYRYVELRAKNAAPNIHIVSNGNNRGLCYSRNYAMEIAKFDYSLIIDADDILMPDAVIAIVDFIETNPSVDFAFGSAPTIDKDGNLLGIRYTRDSFREFVDHSYSLHNPIFYRIFVMHPILLKNKSIREMGGFDVKLPSGLGDLTDLFLRSFLSRLTIRYIEPLIYLYRIHESGLSSGKEKMAKHNNRIFSLSRAIKGEFGVTPFISKYGYVKPYNLYQYAVEVPGIGRIDQI